MTKRLVAAAMVVTVMVVVICGLAAPAAAAPDDPAAAQAKAAAMQRRAFFLEQAQKAATDAGLDLLQEKIAQQLARAALDLGDLGAAQSALTTLIDGIEQRRKQLAFDPVLRQQWFADNTGPYRTLMRVAALQKDPHLALSVGERLRSRVLNEQLAWQKVDLAVNVDEATAARLKDLRAARREATDLLLYFMGGPKPEAVAASAGGDERGAYIPIRGQYIPIRGSYIPIRGPLDKSGAATEEDVKRLRELLDELAQEEAALEASVREAVPAYARASSLTIPTGEELAQAVARDPALAVLHYTLCDEGLAVVALGPGGKTATALIDETREALRKRIGDFRDAIFERKPEALTQSVDLFKLLVAPVQSVLPGATRLWVIAEGAVQLVPFSALCFKEGEPLAKYCAVATAPSLSLAVSTRGERPGAAKPALIVAAPKTWAFGDGDEDTTRGQYIPIRGAYMPIRGEGGINAALTGLASIPLPGAKAEGETIARQLSGATLITGAEATKPALLAAGTGCDILHIATHGYADPELPDLSGLLLAGQGEEPYEVLTAGEVYGWPLNARLVTLSACQTALGKDVEGEGLLGLSRAFIYAGAQDVLCSLWPVSDESTKILMAWLYDGLKKGQPVEEALQSAQKVLMQAQPTSHPFFWAGFTAVRGPE